MKKTSFAAGLALAVALFSSAAMAQVPPPAVPPPTVYRMPPVGIAGIKGDHKETRQELSRLVFVPQWNAWCARIDWGSATYGGCLAEYQIPPEQLRALRTSVGLQVDAPVWNGAKGEWETRK